MDARVGIGKGLWLRHSPFKPLAGRAIHNRGWGEHSDPHPVALATKDLGNPLQ